MGACESWCHAGDLFFNRKMKEWTPSPSALPCANTWSCRPVPNPQIIIPSSGLQLVVVSPRTVDATESTSSTISQVSAVMLRCSVVAAFGYIGHNRNDAGRLDVARYKLYNYKYLPIVPEESVNGKGGGRAEAACRCYFGYRGNLA